MVSQAQEENNRKTDSDPSKWKSLTIVSTVESQEMERQAEPYAMIGFLGGMIAGVVLLRNILCQTVHWIWMGRDNVHG